MAQEELHSLFCDQQSDCGRSARYWNCREVFWRFVDHLCKLLIFLASSGSVCLAAIGLNPEALCWSAAAALATFILETFAVQGKVTFAIKQAQRYVSLLTLFPIDETEEDVELLKRIRNERLMIEKDETIILDCVNVKCHNLQCLAENRKQDMVEMTFWEKTLGQILPMTYHRANA